MLKQLLDISIERESYKLCLYNTSDEEIPEVIVAFERDNIPVVNIGYEISLFLKKQFKAKYLQIEIQELLAKIVETTSKKLIDSKPKIIALYNLGILLEPALGLDAVKILKESSKSTIIILIWVDEVENSRLLHWSTEKDRFSFNFSDINLIQLQKENEI